jgi:hypothetical protein
MTGTSLIPQAAAAAGITFPELCDRIVRLALDWNQAPKAAWNYAPTGGDGKPPGTRKTPKAKGRGVRKAKAKGKREGR